MQAYGISSEARWQVLLVDMDPAIATMELDERGEMAIYLDDLEEADWADDAHEEADHGEEE